MASEGGEALSPAAQLFNSPSFNCHVIAVMGCKTTLNPQVIKEGLCQTMLKHPRFTSKQMPSVILFLDSPQWQWHYDPDLDSLYVVAYSQIRAYVFFSRSLSVSVFTPEFDPGSPYDGVPLHMAHPDVFVAPPAPLVPPPADDPSSSSSSDSNPSEGPDAPGGGEAIVPMANGFL